ncbi:MAG: ornithine cyclodeaminase family protein [Saprospiraceae bacterium]
MKIIPFEQIQKLAKVADLFEPVRQAFIAYNSPNLIGIPVNLLHFKNNADVHIKIAAIDGYDYFSMKVATMFPQNREQNLEPYNGAIFLFDAQTGFPAAILEDKGILTDLRTAAAGAIITDFVAAKSAKTVAVIGTGIQAFNQVHALAHLRTIETVVIYGRNIEKANLLKAKLTTIHPTIPFKIVETVEEAVKSSEIILTTTSSKSALVKGEWLTKGQHITAVGSDDTFKHEIDLECFEKANHIFVDSLELNHKYGEYSHAIKTNSLLADKTIEFGNTFTNEDLSHQENKITIAKLVGVGVQDLAAATVIMSKI